MASLLGSSSPEGSSGSGPSQSGKTSSDPIRSGTGGLYFYINPRTTPTDAALQRLIAEATNTGRFEAIMNDQGNYDWACKQVRQAGGNSEYACGTTMGPGFFDEDKMKYTVNYVMLHISQRESKSMSSAVLRVKSSKSGVVPMATHGFVVLRDLSRVDSTPGIKSAIAKKNAQKAYPGSIYFKGLLKNLKFEKMLYIEGLCANRAAGRGIGIGMMDLVHQIAYQCGQDMYEGCKLAALVYVIQFYFNKFSYRFRPGCGGGGSRHFSEDELREINLIVTQLPRIQEDDEVFEENLENWKAFLYLLTQEGFNAETSGESGERALSLRNPDINFIDDDGDEESISRIVAHLNQLGWQDQGYKMYFCFYNDPLYGITAGNPTELTFNIINNYRTHSRLADLRRSAFAVAKTTQAGMSKITGKMITNLRNRYFGKSGGKKKRKIRKRTKKKALKKRHRRTKRKRHKRKRKTRRRRRSKRH